MVPFLDDRKAFPVFLSRPDSW